MSSQRGKIGNRQFNEIPLSSPGHRNKHAAVTDIHSGRGNGQLQGIAQLCERPVPNDRVDGDDAAVTPAIPQLGVETVGHVRECAAPKRLGMPLVHLRCGCPPLQFDGVVVQVADIQVQIRGEGVVQTVVSQGVVRTV